jgi:hypothetical protein
MRKCVKSVRRLGVFSSESPIAEDPCTLYGARRSVIQFPMQTRDMNRMILPLLLLSYLTFCGGCASERPVDIQPLSAKLTRLKIGMTTKNVSALVGPPIRSEQAATAAGTIVEWYYVEPQFYAGTPSGQLSTKVTFTNGRVSSIQSLSVTP